MNDAVVIAAGLAGAVAVLLLLTRLIRRIERADQTPPDPETAMNATLAKLSERLRSLEEPRPSRAPVAISSSEDLEGLFDVPPRADVFSKRHRWTPGRMYAHHVRWHPAKDAVVLQLAARLQSEAVVFDAQGKLLWAPEGACDLVFRAGGQELVEVGSIYTHDPELRQGPVKTLTPAQSELTWFIARHRWPSGELVWHAKIAFPQGWALELVLSPDESRACVVVIDQCESGWLVVDIAGDVARVHEPMFQTRTNLIGTPVWSPSGHRVAAAATPSFDWWLDGIANDDRPDAAHEDEPCGALGGPVLAAFVFIQDLATDEMTSHEIVIDLPAGWGVTLDAETLWRAPELRFLDERTLEVRMLHGEPRVLSIGNA